MSDQKSPSFTLRLTEQSRAGRFSVYSYKVHRNGVSLEYGIVRGVDEDDAFDTVLRRYLSSREKQG